MNPFGRRSAGSGAIAIQVLGCILAILLLCLPAFSQANFGRILGTVTDSSGGVVANATVTIIDTERGVARTLTTDQAGEYNAPTLIPGSYTVRAEAKGFKKFERQNVFLGVGKEVQVDLIVEPGVQEQTVTVTESLPLVETTNATLGGTLNNADVNDMPLNGRNYQMLLALRPGVMLQPGGGPWTQSTNNIRPDESAWMVDGVLSVNFYDARPVVGASSFITDAATIMPIDAIQEFNLMENPKAEYGWKPGAVVNVGIRSGTNTFHGSAYGFYRTEKWDARNFYNPAATGGTCPLGDLVLCNQTPTQLKQFGGVVGGPIKKDKLFFFAGYEGLRSLIGNALPTHVPAAGSLGGDPQNSSVDAINCLTFPSVANCGSAAGSVPPSAIPLSPVSLRLLGCTTGATAAATACTGGIIQNDPLSTSAYLSAFPNVNTSNNGVAKIDYRINSKNTVNGDVWVARYYGVGIDHPMVNANFSNSSEIHNYNAVGNWIYTPSSLMVNEFRFGYTRSGNLFGNLDSNVFNNGATGPCTPAGCGGGYALNTGVTSAGGFPNINFATLFDGGSFGSWRGRPQQNGPNPFYDVSDSVSYLMGKHTFKFGFEYAHIEADFNNNDERGTFNFNGGAAFAASTDLEDFLAGLVNGGSAGPSAAPNALVGKAARVLTWQNYAGFVQDDWRVTSRLMLNLGLRYSYVSPFKDANNLLGNFVPALGMVQEGQSSVGDTIWKPDHKNFSPRGGFAWDVTGKGTTVIRGGAGLIYSSFVAASFVQQQGQQNFKGGSIAAIPTAANLVVKGVTTNAGGTINLGNVFYDPTKVNWNAPGGGPGAFPAGAVSCADTAPCAILTVDPNLLTPYIANWNLSITRAFTNNLSLEVGYVGNHGSRLTGFRDINQAPVGAAYCLNSHLTAAQLAGACAGGKTYGAGKGSALALAQARPFAAAYPYLSFIDQYSNDSRSNYNSLQATLTQRVSHGLSYTAGYTYGHALDNNSLNRFGALPQDSGHPELEYGNSDFDVRNRFTFTTIYELPGKKGFGQLLEGWKLNSIVTLQSPQPWNIFDSANNFSGSGDLADRWDFFGNPADFKSGVDSITHCGGFGVDPVTGAATTSGASCKAVSGISGAPIKFPATLANECAALAPDPSTLALKKGGCYVVGSSVMVPATLGTYGTMGRNIFRDSGFKNVDFSVFKTFTLKERYSAQFRVEFFNIFNHPIISNPNGASNGGNSGDKANSAASFGSGGGTPDNIAGNPIVGSGGARDMQLGLKLTF